MFSVASFDGARYIFGRSPALMPAQLEALAYHHTHVSASCAAACLTDHLP